MNRTDLTLKAKRDAAIARPELRGQPFYIPADKELPEPGRECLIWARMPQDTYPYRIKFPVIYRDGHWYNAARKTRLQVEVIGWNYRSAI